MACEVPGRMEGVVASCVPFGNDSAAYTPMPPRATEEAEKYSICGIFLKACWTSSMRAFSDSFHCRSAEWKEQCCQLAIELVCMQDHIASCLQLTDFCRHFPKQR